MIRHIAFVLVAVVIALGAWLLLRNGDNETIPVGSGEPTAASPVVQPAALQAAELAGAAGSTVPAEAAVERSAAKSENDQPPIPADSKWIDVLVVDAGTQQPVAGAEVRWNDSSAHAKVEALPEKERQAYYIDPELLARRFGWHTRSDATGNARIATDAYGTSVHARADGRYATLYVGGQQTAPPNGWRLELEADRTLRAKVLDVAGQPAAGVRVTIRIADKDGKAARGTGLIQPTTSKAPDGIAEFRHIQNWLHWDGDKKRQFEVAVWRVAFDVPGLEDPGVEFDESSPPAEPIVLQMPGTGRLAVRLLYGNQPLSDNVSFCAFRGTGTDHAKGDSSERFQLGDDGWAHLPHVALGGELTVRGWSGIASVDAITPAPTGQGQEVRLELRLDGFFALAGRLLGPDGKLLANATAQANINALIVSSAWQINTDAQGRFLWVLTKGREDTAKLKLLVLSQTPVGGPPLQVTVAPRDLVRGTNDLGDLQLTTGALVVGGRFVLDPPDTKQWVDFQVQGLIQRQSDGAEVWERIENLTQTLRPDGTFEVRGNSNTARHRLYFQAQNHLPVEPIEFPLGQADLTIPVSIGHSIAATCLSPADLPDEVVVRQLRGVLRPAGTVTAPKPDPGRRDLGRRDFDRYTARAWNPNTNTFDFRWSALPAGTYTLEIRTPGPREPLATIADVVVPPPEGGDPRLKDIDLRNKMNTRKVHVVLPPEAAADTKYREPAIVFLMPQEDPMVWHGSQVHDGVVVIAAPPGPIELLVACEGILQKRVVTAETEVTITLEPWPTVELTFGDLPQLPAGTVLYASLRNTNKSRNPSFRTEHRSGGLGYLLQPEDSTTEVKDGRARVSIGDGTFRVSVYLRRNEGVNSRSKFLRMVAPLEVVGGSNVAPIAIQLDAAELQKAIDDLQQEPAKK